MAVNKHMARYELSDSVCLSVKVVLLQSQTILIAICFHLLDEGIAKEIDANTIRCVSGQLDRDKVQITISQPNWQEMTHPQRLQCLLAASDITFSVDGDGRAALCLASDL
jgi:hypothetical protein